ncbi:sugar porter family MFS transporter [Ruficoccus amylovorans]|uniref:Sugar porter family MFS transporter n=1 Tax=Ruficoccus amylovorans TaxID=1804625 RepID=A0A842HFD7_9BACT|nr:sugar porter family MFS transporter [Ruficoccus amylovorans]MBC2595233.1 sugar porter family MFS transporter [Ruficoccus amylovorans]
MTKPGNALLHFSLVASLGGFLFGFDTVVISGAEQSIQKIWSLSSASHGLAMSMALWGTVLGSLMGYWPTDRYGRRNTLLGIGILYVVSAIGSALAMDPVTFMVARFIGGVGVGISTVAAPLYISEIAPADKRGRLTGLFQFNIVGGILIAYISNALIGGTGADDWRWMMGVEVFPALLFTALCFTLPESPRWLAGKRGDRAGALRTFQLTQPGLSREELEAKVDEISALAHTPLLTSKFFSRQLLSPISLAFLVAFFNQLSGINAILYFAPRIFEMTGLGAHTALFQSIGIGVINLIFTFLGIRLIDRLGRRTLLYLGCFGYIASLSICSWAFFSENYKIVPLCIFAFIAAHAIGQGTVIWVLISEIFPNRYRAAGQTLGSFTHWFFAAALTMVFPLMVANIRPGFIFLFFCFMMILQLLWVIFKVPETKGLSLEEIEKNLERS